MCGLLDKDVLHETHHHYSTSVVEFSSLTCSAISVDLWGVDTWEIRQLIYLENGSYSYDKMSVENYRLEDALSSQIIYYLTRCITSLTKVTSHCNEGHSSNLDEILYPEYNLHLKRKHQPICPTYTIALKGNVTWSVLVPHEHVVRSLLAPSVDRSQPKTE